MKDVDIISKVVGRKGEAIASPSKDAASFDLSGYLLKEVWDKCWEIRTTNKGEEYIFGKLPVALQYGLTSYVNGGYLDLPSIYDGLAIDNQTIYWDEIKEEVGTDEEGNPIYKTTKVLKAQGGGSGGTGGLDESEVKNIIESYKYVKVDTLNMWAGSAKINTVGTITSGTWQGSEITNDYLAYDYIYIAGQKVSLGDSINSSSLKTALGLNNTLTMDAVDVYISSLQNQIDGLWKRNWFDDLHSTMLMADVASVEELYGDNVKANALVIGDCMLMYDSKNNALTIQKKDGTSMNVLVTGGLTSYSTEV